MTNETLEIRNKKSGKALLIGGIIFLVIAAAFLGVFIATFIDAFNTESFGKAIGLILSIIYFIIPGSIFSFISLIINFVSWRKSPDETRKLRIIPFIISIIILLTFIIGFVYIILSNK